jgi:hypothetical protein
MRSRALRVTLALLAVVGIGVAAWFCWTLQHRINSLDDQGTAFVQARLAASRHAADLQAAQHAYVAAGQNEAFWFERVTAAAGALSAAVVEMDVATASPAARAEVAELTKLVAEFEARDRRVRTYASAGQKLLAADVIFSDGVDGAARIHSTLERAAEAAAVDRAAERRRLSRDQALAAGGATAGALLVMLLLVPLPAPRPAAAAQVPARVETAPRDELSLELRPARAAPARPRAAAAKPSTAQAPARAATPPAPPVQTPAPVPAPPAEPARVAAAAIASAPALHLDAIARVCTDLARLDDTSAMPAILERLATALDAPGLVLWVADADRSELTPIAAHGYPASVLARMRALPVAGENATSSAFRTGLLQTVSGNGDTNGAIAAPLMSPGGCLGVMSAEVRHDGEKQPDRLAAAAIVAAQLATIVGPPAARAQDRSPAAR